jgi:DNA-binding MarR family transcriptional regulator
MDKFREGGFLISKIKQISGRIFDKKLLSSNITDLNTAQGRIIFALWKKDNIPISELVHQTALGKTTLTSMLNRLENTRYIKRTIYENDKRKTIVSLAEKSKLLQEKYEAVSQEMIDLFYDGISNKQIDEFESILHHILNNLIKYEEGQK